MENTTGVENIFEIVKRFFEKKGLSWKMVVGCTNDRAPSMLDCRSGFVEKVSEANIKIKNFTA